MGFFNYLGTIDPALWTGTNAGFTQINFSKNAVTNFLLDDSMLFLIGNVTTQEFVKGLYQAATTAPGMSYWPIVNGKPAVAVAAFPGNDWIADPGGQGYLSSLTNPSPALLKQLAVLRKNTCRR